MCGYMWIYERIYFVNIWFNCSYSEAITGPLRHTLANQNMLRISLNVIYYEFLLSLAQTISNISILIFSKMHRPLLSSVLLDQCALCYTMQTTANVFAASSLRIKCKYKSLSDTLTVLQFLRLVCSVHL